MPARDRRTVGELLADSDALSREMLLDVSAKQSPAMVRTWGQASSPRLDSGRCFLRSRSLRHPGRI